MKKVTKSLMAVLLLSSLLLFTACGNDKEQPAPENKPAQTVKIGLLRIDDSLPFYVAEQAGLFSKNGVNVELVPFGSARDKDVALESGEIDGVMTDLIVTGLLKNGGTDVQVVSTALGATKQEGRFVLLSAPGSEITTLDQLKNVPVAIGNNTIVHYLAEELERFASFKPEEVKMQNIPDLKLRLDALMEGKDVQAAVLPDPLASLAILNGANVVIDDTQLETNLTQSVVIFRTDALQEKSVEIQAAMQAYFAGMELLNANPQDYHQQLVEFSRVPEVLSETYPMPTYTPASVPTEDEVAAVMTWMVNKGLLTKAIPYTDLVNAGFVQQ